MLAEANKTNELGIFIEFPSTKEIIAFRLRGEALENPELRPQVIEEIIRKIQVSDAIDEALIDDFKGVYSVKRSLPNRAFSLHVVVQGGLIDFSLRNKKFPTALLHDYAALRTLLKYCFLMEAPSFVLKLAQDKPKKPAKQLTAAQKALQKERSEAARQAKLEIRTQRSEAARAERQAAIETMMR